MKEQILEILNNPMTIQEIYDELQLNSAEDFRLLAKDLNQLVDEYVLYLSKKDRYLKIEDAGYATGEIRINKKGFGFILQESDDLFVSKKNLADAINGDKVLAKILSKSTGLRKEAQVVKVIEKSEANLVGLYQENRKNGYIILDDKSINMRIDVEKNDRGGAVNGSKVIVEIVKQLEKQNSYLGRVVKVIGHKNDPGIDILSAVYRHNIEIEFSNETLEEIKHIPTEVSDKDLENRRDLRNEIIVTIDGEDAKDLDDAISIEKLTGDKYKLGVHIADVSYYVTEKSAVDKDAASRGTSVYLVDRVIPMLPQLLSNNICSLNPHVDRLTMSCEMILDSSGKVLEYDIFPSVINSKARMTYTAVNEIIKGDQEVINQYKDIYEKFLLMNELAHLIRKARNKRGSLDFDVKEGKIIVDENSKPIDIVIRKREDAERLIEDFMILANETVASHFFYQDLSFIYRIHEKPKEDKIEDFLHISNVMGHKIKLSGNKASNYTIKHILNEMTGEQGYVLKTLLLRSMQKAIYDVTNVGHFGLASKCYTHFTSPIRRYPDLLVHRLIRKYLVNGDYDVSKKFLEKLDSDAKHSSDKERSAMQCEFDILDMKKAEYLHQFVGEEFVGIISSLTNFGIFVELENTVEGLIRYVDMTDDHYDFDNVNLIVSGKRTGKRYKLGDEVKVQVAASNKNTGEIDFVFVK